MLTVGLVVLGGLLGFNYYASLYYSANSSTDSDRGSATGWNEATLALGFCGGSLFGGIAGEMAGNRAPLQLAAVVILVLLFLQVVVHVQQRSA